jgi:hypothetical protein
MPPVASPPSNPWSSRLAIGFVAGLCAVACEDAIPQVSSVRSVAPRLEDSPIPEQDRWLGDFETGELTFRLPDGAGRWVPGRSGDPSLVVTGGGADGTALALAIASDAPASFAAVLAPADAIRAHDYSSCGGLELWAKLDSTITSATRTIAISLQSAGGLSTSSIQVTQNWQLFSLPWSEFSAVVPSNATGGAGGQTTVAGAGGAAGNDAATAGSGGTPRTGAPFDPRTLELVRFEDALGMGLWVDQVKLKACRLLDLNPAIPEPAALGSAGPAGSPVAGYGQLKVQGNQLLDQSGNPVQLKGVSSMWLNWETKPYGESLGALRWMRDNWNLSVVRAALGIEPSGAYLENYKPRLAQVTQMIDNALALGVYVIVDWHVTGSALYLPEARAFFSEIARKYGDRPNVIYEPFNEPTRMSWSSLLKPYHEALVATIRSLDPDNLILLGTPQWSQLVDQAATDPVGGSNLLYTLHFYSCTHAASFRETGDTALAQGIALFVTEFGATAADGGLDGLVCADEAARWFDWMAQSGISGTAWRLDACADSSCILLGGAPIDGGFTDQWLHGHGQLVRDWIKQ